MTTLQFKIGFNSRGNYDNLATYNSRDTVFSGGNQYECTVDGTTGILPTNTANWRLFAQGNLDVINSVTDAPRSNARVSKIFSSHGQMSAVSLMEGGIVVKRGYGGNYNLGNANTSTLPFAYVGLPPSFANESIKQIVGSLESNYLVTESGQVWFWGFNDNGQGGQGDFANRYLPTKIQYFENNGITISEVIVSKGVDNLLGGNYENWTGVTAYFLSTTGKLYGCGYNGYYQLAQGNNNSEALPVPIEPTKTFTKIACSSNLFTSLFAIDDAGDLWAAGWNEYGVLGLGTTATITNLTQVTLPEAVNDIIAVIGKIESTSGSRGGFAIAKGVSGAIYTAGYGGFGQLGDGTFTAQRTSFAQITSLGTDNASVFTNNDGYYGNAGVIKTDGTVKIWGSNGYGELGNGNGNPSSTPVSITFNNTTSTVIKVVAAGTRINTTFAFLFADGTVETTGYPVYGARGNGFSAVNYTPTKFLSAENIVDIQSYGFGYGSGFIAKTAKGNELQTGWSAGYLVGGTTINITLYTPTIIRH